GPMQFIPSTWATYAADGDGNGTMNPQDVDDATLAAADYLCVAGGDLSTPANTVHAVYAYNHSWPYVRAVLTVTAAYAHIGPHALGIGPVPHKHGNPGTRGAAPVPPSEAPLPGPGPTSRPGPTSSPPPSGGPSQSPRPKPTTSGSPEPSTSPQPTDSP